MTVSERDSILERFNQLISGLNGERINISTYGDIESNVKFILKWESNVRVFNSDEFAILVSTLSLEKPSFLSILQNAITEDVMDKQRVWEAILKNSHISYLFEPDEEGEDNGIEEFKGDELVGCMQQYLRDQEELTKKFKEDMNRILNTPSIKNFEAAYNYIPLETTL